MGVKTKYVRSEEEIAAVVQQMAQAAQAQQGAEGAA
jgi:hypothetical protein